MGTAPSRLYIRCVAWGLAAGAVAGAGTLGYAGFVGDLEDRSGVGHAVSSALTGVPFGMIVALVPALLGSLVVLSVVWGSHPQPASVTAVRRDVGTAAYGLTTILAGAVLFAALLEGSRSDLDQLLPYVLVPTACLFVVLWPAVGSIARAWADDGQRASVLSGRPNGSW